MKSKCKHGFDVACLMCGFGEFEGKRVWFDWAWQEQKKRIEELESKVTDLNKNLKDRELAVLVRQEKIDELETRINLLVQKWEKDVEYADQIAREDFVQNTLNDCIEELRQVIKGDMNEQHVTC